MARRILIISEYGLALSSAMVSGLQYKELFDRHGGYDVTFASLMVPPASFWSRRGRGLRRARLGHLVDRLQAADLRRHHAALLEEAAESDVVIAIKIPQIEFHRALVRLERPKILFNFADGLWLPWFRERGWQHLDEILTTSHGIVCECDAVERYARRFNDRIFRVPDAPQIEDFDQWRDLVQRDPGKTVIGWIGGQETAKALFAIFEPLERVFSLHPELHLRIVGATPAVLPHFEAVRWSHRPSYDQESMIKEVLAMDIGLFPLFRVEEALARGTLKAMIYMSGGAAALCQDWGDNRVLIRDGINGMLAATPEEWVDKLLRLVRDPAERREIAARGTDTIRAQFSRQRCFEQLLHAIDSV